MKTGSNILLHKFKAHLLLTTTKQTDSKAVFAFPFEITFETLEFPISLPNTRNVEETLWIHSRSVQFKLKRKNNLA